jgi:hypothetical protein
MHAAVGGRLLFAAFFSHTSNARASVADTVSLVPLHFAPGDTAATLDAAVSAKDNETRSTAERSIGTST